MDSTNPGQVVLDGIRKEVEQTSCTMTIRDLGQVARQEDRKERDTIAPLPLERQSIRVSVCDYTPTSPLLTVRKTARHPLKGCTRGGRAHGRVATGVVKEDGMHPSF